MQTKDVKTISLSIIALEVIGNLSGQKTPICYIKGSEVGNYSMVTDYHEATPFETAVVREGISEIVESRGELIEEALKGISEIGSDWVLTAYSLGEFPMSVIENASSEGEFLTVADLYSGLFLGDGHTEDRESIFIQTLGDFSFIVKSHLGKGYREWKYAKAGTGNTLVFNPKTKERVGIMPPLPDRLWTRLSNQGLIMETRIRDEVEDSEVIGAIVSEVRGPSPVTTWIMKSVITSTTYPICPYCEEEQPGIFLSRNETKEKVVCNNCKRTFEAEESKYGRVSVYITNKIPGEFLNEGEEK